MKQKKQILVFTQEDTMDTNPWEGDLYRRRNKTGYWEGETVSYRRRNTGLYREQYNTTDTDPREGDIRSYRRRYEVMNIGP